VEKTRNNLTISESRVQQAPHAIENGFGGGTQNKEIEMQKWKGRREVRAGKKDSGKKCCEAGRVLPGGDSADYGSAKRK